MKARYIVVLTIAATLMAEFLLRSVVFGGGVFSSRTASQDALVLTNDVVLLWGTNKVGTLSAGQMAFQPCSHDLWLTDPGDPRIWKLYVSFGFNNGRDVVAYSTDVGSNVEQRRSIQMERVPHAK
jgi:hypothetical protein